VHDSVNDSEFRHLLLVYLQRQLHVSGSLPRDLVLYVQISEESKVCLNYINLDVYTFCKRAGRSGFDSRHGQYFFLHSVQTGSGAHPGSYLMDTVGVKRPGHEADHSPTSSAEVKNGGALPSLPHKSS
jgi:hypothetical protein